MRTLKPITILFFCVAATAAFITGSYVPFRDQWVLYEALRTTSGIIVAIMGAWLAVVYPRALRHEFKIKTTSSDGTGTETIKELESQAQTLLLPLRISTFILVVVLLIGIFSFSIKHIPIYTQHAEMMRRISFVGLIILTLGQVLSLMMTFVPSEQMENSLKLQKLTRDLHRDITSQVQTRSTQKTSIKS